MAFVSRKLILASYNAYNTTLRRLNKNAINKNVLQCLQESFDISDDQAYKILSKNSRLNLLEKESILESLQVLKTFHINDSAILENPSVLLYRGKFLKIHGKVLLECGFPTVKINFLMKYRKIMKTMSIQQLKTSKLLPYDINVREKIVDSFKTLEEKDLINFPYDDTHSLMKVRLLVMQKYLELKLDLKYEAFQKICKTYFHFQHRPLVDMEQSLLIASKEIQYSNQKILSYPFVIALDPSNTRKILDNPNSFCGLNVLEHLRNYPNILRAKYSSIIEINNILNEHQIPLSTIKRSSFIYLLKPETLRDRLIECKKNEALEVFFDNPRFLMLIFYKRRVDHRLTQLKNSNKKCASLQSLTMRHDIFKAYFNSPCDKNNTIDVLTVFKQLSPQFTFSERGKGFNSQMKELKSLLGRHQNFLLVSVDSVLKMINFLQTRFSNEIILNNPYLAFYSQNIVEKYISAITKLRCTETEQVISNTSTSNCIDNNIRENSKKIMNNLCGLNVDFKKIDDRQILSLILYLIERNHHFNGDGIWDKDL